MKFATHAAAALLLLASISPTVVAFSPATVQHGSSLRSLIVTSPTSAASAASPTTLWRRDSLNSRRTCAALSASSPNSDQESMDKKANARKVRLISGYISTAVIHLVYIIAAFKFQSSNMAFSLYFSSGPIMYAGLAYILSGAAKADRLSSVTYQRLNIYLGQVGLVSAIMAILEPKFASPLFVAPAILGLVNTIKGYSYGVMGWDKNQKSYGETFTSIFSLAKADILSIFDIKNRTAAVYCAALLMVMGLKLCKIVELTRCTSAYGFATRLSRFVRLSCMVGILVTLKDAANRDRLQGTTFIQLNGLVSMSFATMAGYLLNTGSRALGAAAVASSAFTTVTGVSSWLAKRSKDDDALLSSSSKETAPTKKNAPSYTLLEGEQKINLKMDLESAKVVNMIDLDGSTKGQNKQVLCRCWLSGTFPLCDGSHVKHNAATGDNVGPLIVSTPKIAATGSSEQ